MHVTPLGRVGGSVMLAIPRHVLDRMNLEAGALVDIALDGDRLVVTGGRPRYALADLLARCEPDAEAFASDGEWTSSKAAGRELT